MSTFRITTSTSDGRAGLGRALKLAARYFHKHPLRHSKMRNVNLQTGKAHWPASSRGVPKPANLIDESISVLVDKAIVHLSEVSLLKSEIGHHLVRAAMVFTFFIFGYQKWFSFEANQITPFIQHSPLVFWLIPAFGIRGASFFLGTTEWLFGTLIFLGFWNRKLGMVGALGSLVTFAGTVTIIPFLPNAWAPEAGGFPAMYLPVAFLMKDVLFLVVSFYLFQHDLRRSAQEIERNKVDTSEAKLWRSE
jgi:uncharacterized membrane protein YkgB